MGNRLNLLVAMPKGKIRESFIGKRATEKLHLLGNVIWNENHTQFTPEEYRKRLADIDVCITGWGNPTLDQYILKDASKLKLVVHTGGTVAPIVSDYLYKKGIKVISGNPMYAESVAEGVIAYMLTSLREIPYFANEVQQGRWPSDDEETTEGLLDQTIGLVGFGMITKHLIPMLKPFRVKIKVYSKHITDDTLKEYNIQRASLEEIFSTCKIISIHTSQRPETYHMIDKKLLALIPKGSILINTARGSIIDEKALEEELKTGRFKAILDVYEQEPLPPQSGLRGLKNVILLPHMAGPTYDRREIITLNLIEDIKRFFNNEPLRYEIPAQYARYMTRE